MSRRPRQSRDQQERIEPRLAVQPPSPERAPSAAPTHDPVVPDPVAPNPAPPAPSVANSNPYALPEHVIPAWVARPPAPAPQAMPQAEPEDAARPHEPPAAPPPNRDNAAHAAEASARESYWSKIHVPEEERDRAAKAGLYRYVKDAAPQEAPRKARSAPPRPMNGAGDGKPRIWLTVVALLILFGAGAYGLSQLADAPYAKQNAEWRTTETPEPTQPASIPPAPTQTPAPAPRFIEVAP